MDIFDRALIFKLVVEQGTMAAAARVMNVSPSVISKRIAELESSIGVQLLRRTTRRISVTEAGDNFYHRMRFLQGQWQSLLDETESLGQTPRGRLTIAGPLPVLSRVLMPVLSGFTSRYPEIEIELQSTDFGNLPLDSADLSLSRRIPDFDSGAFVGLSLCRYHNQLFASPEYLKEQGVPESLSNLTKHKCLLYGGNKNQTLWLFNDQETVTVSSKMVSNNTEIIISGALKGLGIAYIPELIIADELDRGDLVPVLTDHTSDPFEMWAYYQQLDYVPLKLRVFLDYLKICW